MKKSKFKELVKDGLNRCKNFLVVKIITEGNVAPEIIINPAENVKEKLKYYNKVYNDDMELISAKESGKLIKIEELGRSIDPPQHIKIKYFDQGIDKLEKIQQGDWIDLRSAETVKLKKGDYYLIRLGVGMILPDGYEAHILPRSSTPSKFGIMCGNSMGVIDNSYSGDADEWYFPAVAIHDTVINKNDRICQFRIVKNQPGITFEVVDHLNEISRGGIGSTGKS